MNAETIKKLVLIVVLIVGLAVLASMTSSLNGIADNLGIYLVTSGVFFIMGVMAALTRKNAIGVFMGIELILNAAALNFVAFQAFKKASTPWLDGQVFSMFIIILAAIEAAVALAIVLRVFQLKADINPDKLSELKG